MEENSKLKEDFKLELRLGLPGEDDDQQPKKKEGYNGNYGNQSNQPILPMGYFSSNSRVVELPNISHKRATPSAPVVGWPPIRSVRKKLASSSSAKPVADLPGATLVKANVTPTENGSHKGLFVKINMEGVVIGRKVDLRAYDNYDKLCSAVGTLFKGLRAAQLDSTSSGIIQSKKEGEKPITGLLDGSGEYTLVYEDHDGDRMLVGDLPWDMFVSTVKRLRVLKTSELPPLSRQVTGGKEGRFLKP